MYREYKSVIGTAPNACETNLYIASSSASVLTAAALRHFFSHLCFYNPLLFRVISLFSQETFF